MWQIYSEHQYLPTKLHTLYTEDCKLKRTGHYYYSKGNTDKELEEETCGVIMFVLWMIHEACVAVIGHALYFKFSLVK
jgi:hypothetical protein